MKSCDSLIESLKTPCFTKHPVILPDFFLDFFVIADDFNSFIDGLESLARQGGGNLLGSRHMVRRGGNSANTAAALSSLGVDPVLIATTDLQGKKLLESLMPPTINLDHVHTDGRLSSTVSIELEYSGRRVNLMVSDSGSASSFGFDDLTESDLDVIVDSGLVCLLNLNHNKNAVELSHGLFQFIRQSGNAITFMDTGDPSGRPEFLKPLLKQVVLDGLVDIIGMNENEACWYAWALSGGSDKWRESLKEPWRWISAAEYVAAETGVQVDLHTPFFSATLKDDVVLGQPSFDVQSKILCGAGDAWNAGSIYGFLARLPDMERLTLANAVAALYVSFGTTEHPTTGQVITFLEESPALSEHGTKLLKPNTG